MTRRDTPRVTTILAITFCCAACARETPPPRTLPDEEPALVRVGEVGASAEGAGPAAVSALREALREAARRLDDGGSVQRPLVLEAAVTALSRTPQGAGVRVRVTVSLSVRDAEGGQILVVLDATAQATGPAAAGDAEREAFEAEVIAGAVDEVVTRLEPRLAEL